MQKYWVLCLVLIFAFLLCGSVKLGLLFSLKMNDHFESPKLFGAIIKLVRLTIGFVVYVFAHDSFAIVLWFKLDLFGWCGVGIYVLTIHS